jgi:NAD(P)-dependent dehydrogenase (short-subunit alcohol dehydrogenase family)
MPLHFITGAGSGIGAVLAARLRERGDDLVLLARDSRRAAELVAQFPGARAVVGDLADPLGLARALEEQELAESIDSLLHVAGVVDLGGVAEMPAEAWQRQLAVNLVGPAELTRLLLPRVRSAGGQIVFVNSGAGLRAAPEWAAYAASKHGLKALADSLRQEEAAHGIRVISVYPGRTATPMQERVYEQEGRDYDASGLIEPASVATGILGALDLPRDAEMTDVTIRPRA